MPRIEDDVEELPRKRVPVAKQVDAEMSRGDLIDALQRLDFVSGHGVLQLDRGVRDYIVRALRDRR